MGGGSEIDFQRRAASGERGEVMQPELTMMSLP